MAVVPNQQVITVVAEQAVVVIAADEQDDVITLGFIDRVVERRPDHQVRTLQIGEVQRQEKPDETVFDAHGDAPMSG